MSRLFQYQYGTLEVFPELRESRARGAITIRPSSRRTIDELDAMAKALDGIQGLMESPIEHLFGVAAALVIGPTGLRIVPQFKLSRYRFDFAILHPIVDQLLALIECDGKKFHSTKEQIANDQRKDNAAKEVGAIMLRYSGAEISRDAKQCAENALGRVQRAWRMS